MKASEVRARLLWLEKEFGDLEVCTHNPYGGDPFSLTGIEKVDVPVDEGASGQFESVFEVRIL